MQINGPFSISIIDNSATQSRELHLKFKPAFQREALAARLKTLQGHINDLQQEVEQQAEDATRQGMLMMLQIVEELYPHIEQDEIPLDETIVIEMGASSPLDKLLQGAVWR